MHAQIGKERQINGCIHIDYWWLNAEKSKNQDEEV